MVKHVLNTFWWRGVWLLALSVFLVACGGLPDGVQLPESPLLRVLERKSGLIAYIGADGNIYTIDQGGSNQQAITNDANPTGEGQQFRLYQHLSWAPDSRRLAFVELTASPNEQGAAVYTSQSDGSGLVKTFSSEQDLPFYLYWTPDGQNVSFLTQVDGSTDLSLWISPADGQGDSTLIGTGQPYYWAWEPNSTRFVAHIGGSVETNPEARLTLVTLGSDFDRDFDLEPTFFRAPAWSPDGNQLMMAVHDAVVGENSLVLTSLQGQIRQKLVTFENSAAFSWSPDGSRIAYILSDRRVEGVFGQLTIVDPNNPEERIVSQHELVAGYFWSPDSRKLAYFVPTVADEGAGSGQNTGDPGILIGVFVMDVRGGESKALAFFRPTPQFLNILPYFDQYHHSATIWSPDSENLVVSGFSGEDPGIWLLAASGNLDPRFLAEGTLAFWSFK